MLQACHVCMQVSLPVFILPGQFENASVIIAEGSLYLVQVVCCKAQVKVHSWAIVLLPGLHVNTDTYESKAHQTVCHSSEALR